MTDYEKFIDVYQVAIADAFTKAYEHTEATTNHAQSLAPVSYEPGTKARLVHDSFRYFISKTLFEDSEVEIIFKYRLLIVTFKKHNIGLLFNKLGKDGRPKNNDTKLRNLINNQGQLSFIDNATFIVFGYALNKIETEVRSTYLFPCVLANKIPAWFYRFENNMIEEQLDLFEEAKLVRAA